ncbi:hypothetical protein QEV68_04265 [Trueperella pyogenes]|uniref:hypothetical protein n=1 Tax=Trueperella pyogenes TaxID=1661 RepID=UPI003245A0B5
MPNKEVKELVKKLESQGFTCETTRKNHIKVRANGRLITTLPSTPSDNRALKNAIRLLAKAGFKN